MTKKTRHNRENKASNSKGGEDISNLTKAFDSPNLFNKRIRKGAVGSNAIDSIQKWAIGLKPYELQFPQNMRTFHEMYTRDESVGGVLKCNIHFCRECF